METRYTDLMHFLSKQEFELDREYYRTPNNQVWQGRFDGETPAHRRWHQHITLIDGNEIPNLHEETGKPTFGIIGFAVEEGVRRNLGRLGAAQGPEALRRALSSLPVTDTNIRLYDFGDIVCPNGNLEQAQEQLGNCVAALLSHNITPVVLGGGHEVTYGHYLGVLKHLHQQEHDSGKQQLGSINFDAHFDNRDPASTGPSSGTGFWQIESIEKSLNRTFNYLALGIQRTGNTQALFEHAAVSGTQIISSEELRRTPAYQVPSALDRFIEQVQHLYLTLDLDVFAASYAPGVSATTALGLVPDQSFFNCLDTILDSRKLVSVDIAELNPTYDIDQRTAKLGAALIHYLVDRIALSQLR